MKIQSQFAILDVKHGRKTLSKHLNQSGPVKVVIAGIIQNAWGRDDGESKEFEVLVTSIDVAELEPDNDPR